MLSEDALFFEDDFLDHAPVGMHSVNVEGTILWANKAELNLLGYPAHEYIGRSISEFHADAEVIEDILVRLKSHQSLENYPARLKHKDGSIVEVYIHSNVHWKGSEFRYTRCITAKRNQMDAIGEVSLTQNLLSGESTAHVEFGDRFLPVPRFVQLNDEIMLLESIRRCGQELTLLRGQNGTSAADHIVGSSFVLV